MASKWGNQESVRINMKTSWLCSHYDTTIQTAQKGILGTVRKSLQNCRHCVRTFEERNRFGKDVLLSSEFEKVSVLAHWGFFV